MKKCNDPADEELDLVRFDEMIRRELFVESIVPHDLNVWLSLITEKGFQELLQDHISMMEVYHSVFTFTSLCNDFEEMEHDDPDKHRAIISELSGYSDWKRRVNAREGNSYLQETLQYIDPATNKMECYEEDLRGLVRLVLNYFERAETWGTFALIVGQNFPNLLSDLQEKMFKAGYYVPRQV
ncbi:hypothetical protein QOZ80_1BG0095360 [Eleusine coracana subsp. coracana]|nr:hypothetical protein QOZ80_1BG0095360 [Eleusine coracana subsp. coracana]